MAQMFRLSEIFAWACDQITRELHVYFGLQGRLQGSQKRSSYAGFATEVAKPTLELRNVTGILPRIPPNVMILVPATRDP